MASRPRLLSVTSVRVTSLLPLAITPALLSPSVLLTGLGVALISCAIPISLELFALKHLPKHVFGTALLHNSRRRRHDPNPRRTYPKATVTGRPSWLNRLSSATRMCNSVT